MLFVVRVVGVQVPRPPDRWRHKGTTECLGNVWKCLVLSGGASFHGDLPVVALASQLKDP